MRTCFIYELFFFFKDDVFSLLSSLKTKHGFDDPEPHCCGIFSLMAPTAPALGPRMSSTRSIQQGQPGGWSKESCRVCIRTQIQPYELGPKHKGGNARLQEIVRVTGPVVSPRRQKQEPAPGVEWLLSLSLSCYWDAPYSTVVLQCWALYKHLKIQSFFNLMAPKYFLGLS